jgi:hypothetical protein
MRLAPFYPAVVVFMGAVLVAFGGFWASWRQSNFNSEIRAKNEEITRLQRANTDAIIGGDSFCWMELQIAAPDGSLPNANNMPDDLALMPLFVHAGAFPLYDVSARIVDLDILNTDIQHAFVNSFVGNMTPGFARNAPVAIRHHGKNFNFNIFYVARNGSWTQYLRMRWVGNGWASASKVLRGSTIIRREVSNNFPTNEAGKVDWGDRAAHD